MVRVSRYEVMVRLEHEIRVNLGECVCEREGEVELPNDPLSESRGLDREGPWITRLQR